MVDTQATLHHYTTAVGLMGIFEPHELDGCASTDRSLTLWATDARYMNDTQELTYAAKRLATALRAQIDSSDPECATYISELADRIRQGIFLDPDGDTPHPVYVTSFCENSDLLSQWRAYGVGGYSIAFPVKVLKKFWVPVLPQPTDTSPRAFSVVDLVPVRYRIDDDGEDFIERRAQRIVAKCRSGLALPLALQCLAQFKNPAFEEEREWRLFPPLETASARASFRVSAQGMLIPYLPLRFTPEPIIEERHIGPVVESVCVGPSSDQQSRVESVKRMLRQWSFEDVAVTTSGTPFRA